MLNKMTIRELYMFLSYDDIDNANSTYLQWLAAEAEGR